METDLLEHQRFLLALNDALRLLTDPVEIQVEAARLLGEHLRANRVGYGVPVGPASDERLEVFVARSYARDVAEASGVFNLVDFGFSPAAILRGCPLSEDDVMLRPFRDPTQRVSFEQLAIRSWVLVPLLREGRLEAILVLHQSIPRHWKPAELSLVEETALRTWTAVQRCLAEAALRESEAQLKLVLDTAELGTWKWNLETGTGEMDARAAEFFGVKEGKLENVAQVQLKTVHPDDLASVHAQVLAGIQSGAAFSLSYRAFAKDGSLRHMLARARLLPREQGQPDRLIGTNRDVTLELEARARQTLLLNLSDRMRALPGCREVMTAAARMLGAHLGVATVVFATVEEDEDSAVVEASYNAGGLPEVAPDTRFTLTAIAIGWREKLRRGQDLYCDDSANDPEGLFSAEPLRAFGLRSGSVLPLVRNGRLTACLVTEHPLPRRWSDTDRQLCREVAERTWGAVEQRCAEKYAQAQRAQLLASANTARARAEEDNRAKDEFLATLSHELRTPLAPILLWARALKAKSVPPEDMDQALAAMVQSAESQARLIEDLLDLTRLQSGKLLLSPQVTWMGSLAQHAMEVVQPLAQAKGVALSLSLEPREDLVLLDSGRVHQVLWNLLSNAVKFTPPGGRVMLRMRQHERALEATVSDTGEGIPAEFMPQLFERFRQANMTESRAHAGMGIGLALARHLVQLHGGTLAATSEGPGHGATFTMQIPWVEPPLEVSDEREGPGPATPTPSVHGVRVLVVENDASTRQVMRWTLERAGASVMVSSSGADALQALLLAPSRPQVLVCDIGLPQMNGFELMEHVASTCRARGEPVIPACAVSAHAREVDRQRALAAGFQLHLAKPLRAEALIGAVEALARPHDR